MMPEKLSKFDRFVCEVAFVLVGGTSAGIWHVRMIWRAKGSAASVDFDWRRVLAREEKSGDVLGFYHSHPPGLSRPSGRDDKTMTAWSSCFGKPLLCLIDDGGTVGGWIYDAAANQESDHSTLEVYKIVRFPRNWFVAIERPDIDDSRLDEGLSTAGNSSPIGASEVS
jgi:hypothetical protein